MGLLIYGQSTATTDIDEFLVKCPACESHQWAEAMIISLYYHIYYVPMFPFDKEADLVCQNCGMRRYGVPLGTNLISNYHEVKKRFHHPWFTYSGVGFVGFIVIVSIVVSLI